MAKKKSGALTASELNFLIRWSKTRTVEQIANNLGRTSSSIKPTYLRVNKFKNNSGLKNCSTKNVLNNLKFKTV